MSPMPYATYFAPATIRIWAHAPDSGTDNIRGYSPPGRLLPGHHDDRQRPPHRHEHDRLLPGGRHQRAGRVLRDHRAQLSPRAPSRASTSRSRSIDVAPHAGPNRQLDADLVLTGSTSLEIIGTADARALITSSNGSRIRSSTDWTGHLTIRYADIIGLGGMDVPGIQVTANGTNTIEISSSVFDRCGPPQLAANGQAPIIFRGNTLQPNTLTPVNAEANYAGSHPSLTFSGGSTAAKFFQGNNVGVSFVRFDRSSNWMIGGTATPTATC